MISRRQFGGVAAGAAFISATKSFAAESGEEKLVRPELGPDGLYVQPWFLNSFLVLKEDLEEAAAAGKRFAIFWEQKGCPYCKETHMVNLAKPGINKYIRENFVVLQLNMWGSRKVTDFDGQEMEERALARKWGITFTPTIMFLDENVAKVGDRPGVKAEVARMPGYFKPFHFISMFQYVREKAYERQHFQKYIPAKADEMRKQGKEVKIW
jgi:thioredoxin-related protein